MSAEEAKPVLATEPPAAPAPVESIPTAAVESSETPAVPVTEVLAAEAAPVEPATDAAAETPAVAETAAVAETTDKKVEEKKPVEPVYSGVLSYKVHHGLKSLILGPKKRYFWFGEDVPITTPSLNNFLRGEKQLKTSHAAAAWSNKTGKGLLYFVKHAADKTTPNGVLVLADVTDISEVQTEFSFKLDGMKHSFEAKTVAEREGWVLALKTAVEEAKAAKEGVVGSSEYKDAMASLSKPVTAGLAVIGATTAAAKKSTEIPKETTAVPSNGADTVAETPVEEAKEVVKEEMKEKKTSKSRSVSRGKRNSIFGSIMGKKDEVVEKVEAKKEDKVAEEAEVDKEAPVAEPVAVAPAVEAPAAVPEPIAEETALPAAPVSAESTTAESKPAPGPADEVKAVLATITSKASKRASVFGGFFDKVRSPITEKKESDVGPVVPPKDEPTEKELPAAPAAETPPVAEEVAQAGPVASPAAAVSEEKKEKKVPSSTPLETFFGKLKARAEKVRSPSTETPPALPKEEETATTEAPAAAPAAAAVEVPTETPAAEVPTNGAAEKVEESTDKRRSSFFGGLGETIKKKVPTSDSEGESTAKKLGGLFRSPSKMIKGAKEGKKPTAPTAATPAKADEESNLPLSDEAPKLEAPAEIQPLAEETPAVNSIGDVVPEAVQVGQPPEATPAVSATA